MENINITRAGDIVKGWCKCGAELDCVIKEFSNKTLHAYGTCPKCGLAGYKQQRLPANLEDLKHRLMGIYSSIKAMPKGVNQDEAICMIERLVADLWREVGE